MQRSLALKARIIGTPLESVAKRWQRLREIPRRIRHPEQTPRIEEERYTEMILGHYIQPDWNCADVGAHIGSMTNQLCRLAPNGSHVVVEPTPSKAALLRDRYPNVTVHEAAVTEADAELEFHEDHANPAFSGLGDRNRSGSVTSYTVAGRTLDGLLDGHPPISFLKLDVEGAELPALRGATRLLTTDKPMILFECSLPKLLEPFGYTRRDLFDFLDANGYAVRSLEDVVFGRSALSGHEFTRGGEYPFPGFNYVATPTDMAIERFG